MAAGRVRDRLRHRLEAAIAAERLAAGKSIEDYRADPDRAAAVECYLERLSEASRHVPQTLKDKHPTIDRRGVAGIGNVLRHADDQVSERRVPPAATEDLPALKAAIEGMLAELGSYGAR